MGKMDCNVCKAMIEKGSGFVGIKKKSELKKRFWLIALKPGLRSIIV